MPRVTFAASLQRHVPCPDREVDATTVREALGAVSATEPCLSGYVLDDQGCLRPHVAVFVDGRNVADPHRLTDAVAPDAAVHVIQALSGG